jgi:molybdenum cofactor cytidylyltransferase
VNGLLVTLVDVPLIDADTVRRLREVYDETRAPIVRPSRGRRHGHPVIFDRALFDELRRVDPTLGAKPVVRAHLDDVVDVPIDREGPFVDVDTPTVYARVFGREVPEGLRGGPR